MNNVEKALKLIEDSINKKCNGLECKVVKNNINLRLENIQLKRQIDLMAEYIEKVTVDMKIAFGENMLWDRNQIKQDFEKLAKEKGE